MANRLTKIYTKTGDSGTTALSDGVRIDKDNLQLEAMGDIDELNSCLGLLLSENISDEQIAACLAKTQHLLFDVGGEISMPSYQVLTNEHVSELEKLIDALLEKLPPLKDFIMPKGNKAVCYAHLSRSICRRAERRIVSLHKIRPLNLCTLKFINRLSDLLFVIARILSKEHRQTEVLWDHERRK